jgi:hypothetical protein
MAAPAARKAFKLCLAWDAKPLLLALLLEFVCALQGCETDHRPAPTPTVNPHPHKILKLKITVEPSVVDKIEVNTQWVVTNLSCAPIQSVSGAAKVKQISVKEPVDKEGDTYIASIVLDRFLPDNCHWSGSTAQVRFFHGDYLLAVDGVNSDVELGERKDVLTCLTSPFVTVGICSLRSHELFFKKEDPKAFNAIVELDK